MGIFLMATAIIFILIDVLRGFRRGFFPALVRLGVVFFCALFAFMYSASVSHYLMEIHIFDGESLQELYEGYLHSQEGLSAALALSDPIEQIVFHLPEVLLSEIAFVLLFFLARLVTLPVSALISRIFFGKRGGKKKINGEEKKNLNGSFRSGGAVVGLLQAVLCLVVLLVPVFGIVEFCDRFDAAFADADEAALSSIAEDAREYIVDPVDDSMVGSLAESTGVRDACTAVFHRLSDTTIVIGGNARTIDYFEYLESMFPAIAALLKLVDVDPEHMTDTDYENLSIVLDTAQSHEDISDAVKDSVTNVVAEFVDDSFRSSADVVVSTFTDKVMSEENKLDGVKLKAEIASVQDTLKVIQTATSEAADSAFEVIPADVLVDGIIETEILYETLIEVANDPEKCEILRRDFVSSDEQKAMMKSEIESYRAQSAVTRPYEEVVRIKEITDALALVLDVDISEIPYDYSEFIPAA